MKRLWLGVGILGVLLGLSIWVQLGMHSLHSPMARELEQAAQAALADDWEQAGQLYQKARQTWEKNHTLTASVADHSPMDEMDMLLAELSVFEKEREKVHFAALCRSAAQMAQAMSDAHRFTWWSLL